MLPTHFDFYALVYYFFIYSFLGWVMESTLNTVKQNFFINRGFLLGPYCPIYGVSMCTLYLLCFSLREHHFLVFISGMFFSTLLEYLTGHFMEKLFHTKWWDYSHFRYNFHGQICLHISVVWGFLSLLFISYIHPTIMITLKYIPLSIGNVILIMLCLVFIIDFIYSIQTALKLTTKFPALSEMRLEIIALLEQNKFHETQLRKRLVHTLIKYHTHLNRFTLGEKRLLKAFPSLKLTSIKTIKNKFINRGK